jgi:hypothetical protein
MATIYGGTGGNFSAITWYKTVSSYVTPSTGRTENTDFDTLTSTPITIAFTPSEAGTVTGVVLGVWINSILSANTINVHLEKNDGGWGDVTGATCTVGHDVLKNAGTTTSNGSMVWYYFAFATPAAVTTDASTWRLSISAGGSTTASRILCNTTSNYAHAVVISATTTYSANDNLVFTQDTTVTIDQSVTFTTACFGTKSILQWQNPPSSSYTLTGTSMYFGKQFQIIVGTEAYPIPLAQKATWSVTNLYNGHHLDSGCNGWSLSMWGAKVANLKTTLSANAAKNQKVIVTTDDMSAYWSSTDSIYVGGGDGSNIGHEIKVIDTIVGKTITFTTNLTQDHYSGFAVYDRTLFANAGINVTTSLREGMSGYNMYKLEVSGVQCTYPTDGSNWLGFSGYSGNLGTGLDSTLLAPTKIDGLYCIVDNRISIQFSSSTFTPYTKNGYIKNVYICTNGYGGTWSVYKLVGYTIENVYSAVGSGGIASFGPSYPLVGCTFTNCEFSGGGSSGFIFAGDACTFTSCHFASMVYVSLSGSQLTFDTCWFEDLSTTGIQINSGSGNKMIDCQFGQKIANLYDFYNIDSTYSEWVLSNCSDFVAPYGITGTSAGSFVKAHKYDSGANDHRSWYTYGNMLSTGDGLTDTTVHTSGTGKFALRFEPLSSTSNLDWDITIPTGNIQNSTMFVGVWVKINAATYYAGTHQLPRLTISYDNDTATAYAQAAESTDWQLLFVPITPTTTYGQITATLSARTDATTTDAYIYWDDFMVAYPPNVSLDLGGMDLWADALPIVPPLAIPISAKTVSSAVWEELLSSHTTAATFGKQIGSKLLTLAKFLGLK